MRLAYDPKTGPTTAADYTATPVACVIPPERRGFGFLSIPEPPARRRSRHAHDARDLGGRLGGIHLP